MATKKGLFDLHEMKRAGEKIGWLTAYDYPTPCSRRPPAST